MANFKAIAVVGTLVLGLYVAAQISPLRSQSEPSDPVVATRMAAAAPQLQETYRLIHSVENSENEAGRGLSQRECEARKADLKVAATALGTYSEALGIGSIVCLPESSF